MSSASVESSLSKMSLGHRRVVKRYLAEQEAKGLSESSLRSYAGGLLKASRSNEKPFEKWVKSDCIKLLKKINNQNSKNSEGILLKSFMRSLGKESIMSWWKPRQPSFSSLPDAIPTQEEVEELLKEMPDLEYRSFFRVLVNSGARIGSILTLKVHQVTFDEHCAIITLPRSKTGQGLRLRLVSARPLLRDWINQSPRLPDGRVWDISYTSANRHFHAARKRAGIEKPMTIHSLRHFRATELARSGMSEQLLRRHFGWRPGSRMTERYAHLSDKDLDDAVLKADGIRVTEEEPKPAFKPIICPNCQTPNDSTYSFCMKCSWSLTGAETTVDGLLGTLNKILETTDVNKEFDELVKLQKIYGPDSFRKQERITNTLIALSGMSKKIALGLVALDQGAKQLDAAAEREGDLKKVRKPRARS